MATEFYLKIVSKLSGELKGGATSKLCKDQIQVSDFLISARQPFGPLGGGSGESGPKGLVILEDVEFEVPVNVGTVALFDAITRNEVLKEVKLTCLKVGNNPHIYLQWGFNSARLLSYKLMAGPNDEPIHKLKFTYGVIEVAYKHQKQTGEFEPTRSTAFSTGENKTVEVTLDLK